MHSEKGLKFAAENFMYYFTSISRPTIIIWTSLSKGCYYTSDR